MKNYFHIAFIVLVLGIVIAPKQILACDNMKGNLEMACCKKNKVANVNDKSCCQIKKIAKNQSTQIPEEKTKKDCDDCNQNCCSSAPTTLSFVLPAHFILVNRTFNSLSIPQKFSYIETYASSGFHFIWQPPKLV